MRYIYVILAVLIISSACKSQSSPNTPSQPPTVTLPATPNTPIAVQITPPQTIIQPTTPYSDETIRIARTELERDAYKQALQENQKSFDNLKWVIQIALTAIGLILAIFGLVLFKNTKEFKEAVVDARKACEKAEEWEEKARAAFEKIDTRVESKLKEIDERVKIKLEQIEKQGKESIKEIDDKTENQMRISQLWSDALRLYNEGKYEEACDKYAQIVNLKPDKQLTSIAYNNWGANLNELAQIQEDENLFKEACRKFDQAIKSKPDNYDAYNNWGCVITEWARIKDDENLFEEACQKFEQAIKDETYMVDTYINWGNTLALLAKIRGNDNLFKEAQRKYEQAIKINPNEPRLHSGWGGMVLYWARLKIGTQDYENMLTDAEEKSYKAETLRKGSGAYVLARICALKNDKEGCKKWLELGQGANDLPRRKVAMKDSIFDNVKDEAWFKEIKWKGEK